MAQFIDQSKQKVDGSVSLAWVAWRRRALWLRRKAFMENRQPRLEAPVCTLNSGQSCLLEAVALFHGGKGGLENLNSDGFLGEWVGKIRCDIFRSVFVLKIVSGEMVK